jgi:calcineurin-like phosphoesterase family protein
VKHRQRRYIADPHLGHEKVAALRGYEYVWEHDQAFVSAWQRSVPDDDTTVFVLGDLSSGGAHAERAALAVINTLPGSKHLILGNHDRGHPLQVNGRKHLRDYYAVFDSVSTADKVGIAGRDVMLSHFPYTGEHGDRSDRHPQWRLRDEGRWLVHGHVHDAWTVQGRQICVSWEKWPHRFATDNDIIALMDRGERLVYESARQAADRLGLHELVEGGGS